MFRYFKLMTEFCLFVWGFTSHWRYGLQHWQICCTTMTDFDRIVPVILKNNDKICSFMQRMLFKSTGNILVVLMVSRVRFVPCSRENQRDEKSQPDSAAETRSWWSCLFERGSEIFMHSFKQNENRIGLIWGMEIDEKLAQQFDNGLWLWGL